MQRLNDALLKLDSHNKRKSEMSQKLVDTMKFVKDLQKATT
jgi:5-bromo-4-chloroindolyl phosphate hydrolysis protein